MGDSSKLGTNGDLKETDSVALYLDMVKRSLMDSIYWDDPMGIYTFCLQNGSLAPWKRYSVAVLERLLARYKMRLVRPYSIPWLVDYSRLSKEELATRRLLGDYWPVRAHTMIGEKRLDNLQFCVETAIKDGIPGDLIETGVWRGGACIFMRAILKAYGDTTRTVWVADSFAGLPPPNETIYRADAGDIHHTYGSFLAVSRAEVEENFRRYNLLDGQVRFLEGWFKDTLPRAPIHRLAVLRLDGDMYASTIQALEALYDKLSNSGFVIVDDYHLEPCKQAITDFRLAKHIDDAITDIDGKGIFWRKTSQGESNTST
jgi:O-methyltransferase